MKGLEGSYTWRLLRIKKNGVIMESRGVQSRRYSMSKVQR